MGLQRAVGADFYQALSQSIQRFRYLQWLVSCPMGCIWTCLARRSFISLNRCLRLLNSQARMLDHAAQSGPLLDLASYRSAQELRRFARLFNKAERKLDGCKVAGGSHGKPSLWRILRHKGQIRNPTSQPDNDQ